MIICGEHSLKVVKVQAFQANRSKTLHFGVASDGYGIRFLDDAGILIQPTIWFPMYFYLHFGEVKIICAFVAFSADPTYFRFSLKQVIPQL